jgi:hypothetical protein
MKSVYKQVLIDLELVLGVAQFAHSAQDCRKRRGFTTKNFLCLAVFLLFASLLHATIFGKIQGIVHDPQHRPVAGASVKLQAITSDWSQATQADDNGEFSFTTVPIGDYKISVTQSKFESAEQTVTVSTFNWRSRP